MPEGVTTNYYSVLLVIAGAVVTVLIGGSLIGRATKPYSDQLEEDSGLDNGGRIIGFSERLLIYVFVLAGAPSPIGYLVTAKSIFRFGNVSKEDAHAEYVIIGTLMSFAYAVTVSYLFRWLLVLTATPS